MCPVRFLSSSNDLLICCARHERCGLPFWIVRWSSKNNLSRGSKMNLISSCFPSLLLKPSITSSKSGQQRSCIKELIHLIDYLKRWTRMNLSIGACMSPRHASHQKVLERKKPIFELLIKRLVQYPDPILWRRSREMFSIPNISAYLLVNYQTILPSEQKCLHPSVA